MWKWKETFFSLTIVTNGMFYSRRYFRYVYKQREEKKNERTNVDIFVLLRSYSFPFGKAILNIVMFGKVERIQVQSTSWQSSHNKHHTFLKAIKIQFSSLYSDGSKTIFTHKFDEMTLFHKTVWHDMKT